MKINVLGMVKRVMGKKHISSYDLSKKLNRHHTSILGMLSRESMQVQKLVDLSEICQYNFFREIAGQLPYHEPDYQTINKEHGEELMTELAQLKEENKILKVKLDVLNDVITKLGK